MIVNKLFNEFRLVKTYQTESANCLAVKQMTFPPAGRLSAGSAGPRPRRQAESTARAICRKCGQEEMPEDGHGQVEEMLRTDARAGLSIWLPPPFDIFFALLALRLGGAAK